ncbi:unnamed protein product [Protopolystoma xenopodis]|uniref:Uncharacterized protein n=1 Tax=Protopolystoma xenopodis TaxID=117903 RepID=A0A3S5ALU8_9PLAT|nr:unnamed protein product [Protopolystoma xenopodis]
MDAYLLHIRIRAHKQNNIFYKKPLAHLSQSYEFLPRRFSSFSSPERRLRFEAGLPTSLPHHLSSVHRLTGPSLHSSSTGPTSDAPPSPLPAFPQTNWLAWFWRWYFSYSSIFSPLPFRFSDVCLFDSPERPDRALNPVREHPLPMTSHTPSSSPFISSHIPSLSRPLPSSAGDHSLSCESRVSVTKTSNLIGAHKQLDHLSLRPRTIAYKGLPLCLRRPVAQPPAPLRLPLSADRQISKNIFPSNVAAMASPIVARPNSAKPSYLSSPKHSIYGPSPSSEVLGTNGPQSSKIDFIPDLDSKLTHLSAPLAASSVSTRAKEDGSCYFFASSFKPGGLGEPGSTPRQPTLFNYSVSADNTSLKSAPPAFAFPLHSLPFTTTLTPSLPSSPFVSHERAAIAPRCDDVSWRNLNAPRSYAHRLSWADASPSLEQCQPQSLHSVSAAPKPTRHEAKGSKIFEPELEASLLPFHGFVDTSLNSPSLQKAVTELNDNNLHVTHSKMMSLLSPHPFSSRSDSSFKFPFVLKSGLPSPPPPPSPTLSSSSSSVLPLLPPSFLLPPECFIPTRDARLQIQNLAELRLSLKVPHLVSSQLSSGSLAKFWLFSSVQLYHTFYLLTEIRIATVVLTSIFFV